MYNINYFKVGLSLDEDKFKELLNNSNCIVDVGIYSDDEKIGSHILRDINTNIGFEDIIKGDNSIWLDTMKNGVTVVSFNIVSSTKK